MGKIDPNFAPNPLLGGIREIVRTVADTEIPTGPWFVNDDFSGLNIQGENEFEETVSIEVSILDSLDTWQKLGSLETKRAVINGSIRGLDTLSYQTRITVRDRFLNYTDTLTTVVNPLFEQMLDKSLFSAYDLPGDVQGEQDWLPMSLMWDNGYDYTYHYRWLTLEGTSEGAWSTFDIGIPAQLSRLTLFNWGNDGGTEWERMFYYGEHMRFFEIWGSNNPNTDGSWGNWTLLGSFENIKPSGLPYGQQSQEDFDAAVKGFEFTFPVDNPQKVRFLRIKNLQNWQGTTKFGIVEIDLYGDPR